MSEFARGTIVATHGRHYLVEGVNGQRLLCVTRGKKGGAACADRVEYREIASGQGVIEQVLPRTNLFYRSDLHRTKLLAANVTQVAVVLASEPPFSEDLLGRALVAAGVLEISTLVLLNKCDLIERRDAARLRLAPYSALGYRVIEISVKTDPAGTRATLRPLLSRHSTLLLGQSGMGKSSLLNLLVPGAAAATNEISQALHAGKHTTTDARLYRLPEDDGELIDTPGFQEFGLAHLSPGEIERAFPELAPYLGKCRFYNCSHLNEPACAVRGALASGAIASARYTLFEELTRAAHAVASARLTG